MDASAAIAKLTADPNYSTRARLEHLLSSLRFDERVRGHDPERSTVDFPRAIEIVERAIADLTELATLTKQPEGR